MSSAPPPDPAAEPPPEGAKSGARFWRRTGTVLSGTLLSRVLGAVRDATIAALFVREVTDAFFVAFTIPNALRALLAEGAVSGAVVPVYTEVREKHGSASARNFLGNVAATLTILVTIISILGVALAPFLATLYAPGYGPERLSLTTLLIRWTFPYVFFVALSALASGALNAAGRFAIPAVTPALLNLALVVAAFFLSDPLSELGYPAVLALAVGALSGGVLQVAFQLPLVRSLRLFTPRRPSLSDPYLRKSARLFVPLIAGLGVYQANILLARVFASFLPAGAQSHLFYSQRVIEIPQGMFAIAVSTVSLPLLSSLVAKGALNDVKLAFGRALRTTLLVAIPSTVALAVLAHPTAAVLFGRGAFVTQDIEATGDALRLMACGIWAVATVRTAIPMFHAFNDTRAPVIASAANLATFCIVSAALLQSLGHLALALALPCASIVQLVTLFLLLRKRVDAGLDAVGGFAGKMTLCTVPMALVVWFIRGCGEWEAGATFYNIFIYGLAVLIGAAIYLGLMLIACPEEASILKASLKRKRSKG